MEEQVIDVQEQLDRPMILVVKGQPRGEVACELAKHLKYALIDHYEIISVLQNSEHFDEISFQIILRIASIQLTKLKLGVIISTPLAQQSHCDDLKKLANSTGAILVIIQCLPEDGSSDFDIKGVPKLTVNTRDRENSFVAEKFVSEELDKVKKRFYRHLHALTFIEQNIETGLECKRCKVGISGPIYQCILGCDEYIFDKSCAELQGDLEQVRGNCPRYLSRREPKYPFPMEKRQKCKLCEYNGGEFSDNCHDCLFQTNMKGNYLPIIVNHGSHAHPLNLVMMPVAFNYEFACSVCGDFGHSISYRCYDCNFNLHVGCVLLPPTVSYDYDKHPLRLTYYSLEQNYSDKSICEACNKERNPEHWFYYCPACESTIHLDCARISHAESTDSEAAKS